MTTSSESLEAEVRAVVRDLSWLEKCVCSEQPLNHFFVRAGHTIPAETMLTARLCPARREEVIWAYARDLRTGYFGGLSGSQRAAMTLAEALEFVEQDTRAARVMAAATV